MTTEPNGIARIDPGLDSSFASGGVMGRLMAAKDWSATPLGPIREWSPSLRTSVGICLESRFPIVLNWGRELAYLYNDAIIPILGRKHPDALGRPLREVWPEIWDFLFPSFDQVMSGSGPTWYEDQRLLLFRHGYLEECYFTFSFGPVRDADRDGRVVGAMTTVQETTRQMVDTRRLACLRALATTSSRQRGQRSVCAHATAVLAQWVDDIPFCVVLLRDQRTPRSPPRSMGFSGLADDRAVVELLGALEPGGPLPEVGEAVSRGRIRTVADLRARCPLRLGAGAPPSNLAVAVPFAKGRDGLPIGLLLAGVSDRLALDDEYRDFIKLVAGQISTAVVSARGQEAERAKAALVRRRALHDGLTGLPNRTSFIDRLNRALVGIKAGSHREQIGLLFVDLDGFKAVNDSLGHQAGDDLLREVAVRLQQSVRPSDFVARLAGDEFAVLCEQITSPDVVTAIADRIVDAVVVHVHEDEDERTVTSSIGIALSRPDLTDPDEILHAADIAMYAAKRQGRNRYVLFDETLRTRAQRRRKKGERPVGLRNSGFGL